MTVETTVGELVRAVPARSRVFENLGIDYCCGGKKPLTEVCRAKGMRTLTTSRVSCVLAHPQRERLQAAFKLVAGVRIQHAAVVRGTFGEAANQALGGNHHARVHIAVAVQVFRGAVEDGVKPKRDRILIDWCGERRAAQAASFECD